jgi:hypothetical protein
MAISFPLKNQEEEDEKEEEESRCFHFLQLLSTLLFAFPQSSLKINRPSVCIYL